jgi:hypothetical protein
VRKPEAVVPALIRAEPMTNSGPDPADKAAAKTKHPRPREKTRKCPMDMIDLLEGIRRIF